VLNSGDVRCFDVSHDSGFALVEREREKAGTKGLLEIGKGERGKGKGKMSECVEILQEGEKRGTSEDH
jgi:hypothetical protein